MTTLTIESSAPRGAACLSPFGVVARVARREFRDAAASRWFLLYTIGFAVLAIGVSFMSLAGTGSHGLAGFGRTAAGMLNLVMLVVPLMALTAGAGAIAGERERGTLLYILAQPVSRTEVILGKYLGLGLALCCSVWLGFGLSAGVVAWRAGGADIDAFLLLVLFTCALALAMLSVGVLISVMSRRVGIATGLGLFVWIVLVFLSDLGLMAGALIFKLRVQEVFAVGVANPLQAFKMSVIVAMNASLDVLGPVGVYASRQFGGALAWILSGVLGAWIVAPLAAAIVLFSRRAPA